MAQDVTTTPVQGPASERPGPPAPLTALITAAAIALKNERPVGLGARPRRGLPIPARRDIGVGPLEGEEEGITPVVGVDPPRVRLGADARAPSVPPDDAAVVAVPAQGPRRAAQAARRPSLTRHAPWLLEGTRRGPVGEAPSGRPREPTPGRAAPPQGGPVRQMVERKTTTGARKRTAAAVTRAGGAAVVAVIAAVDGLVGPGRLTFPTPVQRGVAGRLIPGHHGPNRLGCRLNRRRHDRPLLG